MVGAALVSGYALVEIAAVVEEAAWCARGRSCCSSRRGSRLAVRDLAAALLPLDLRAASSYVTEWAPTTLTLVRAHHLLALEGFGCWAAPADRLGFEQLAFVGLSLLAFDAVRNAVWLAVRPRRTAAAHGHTQIAGGGAQEHQPSAGDRDAGGRALATVIVAFKPASWFTKEQYRWPPRTSRRRQQGPTTGSLRTRPMPTGSFESAARRPHRLRLALRAAHESPATVGGEFRNRVNGWRSTIGGYRCSSSTRSMTTSRSKRCSGLGKRASWRGEARSWCCSCASRPRQRPQHDG